MTRGKILAIATGAISVLLAVAYLLLVQLLDFRGEMKPAPVSARAPARVAIAPSPTPQAPNILLSAACFNEDAVFVILEA